MYNTKIRYRNSSNGKCLESGKKKHRTCFRNNDISRKSTNFTLRYNTPVLLNMSKAFNTSNRAILLKDLIQMKPIQINLPSQNHA